MELTYAQVFGEDYEPAEPLYPCLSIHIEDGNWETFKIDDYDGLLERLNEIVNDAEGEGMEYGQYVIVYREWSERNDDMEQLFMWEYEEQIPS